MLFAACTLDEEPRDQIPEEQAYSNEKDLYLNTVATLYNYIGGKNTGEGLQGTCRGVYDLQTFGSDEALLPIRGNDWYDGGIWEQLYIHNWDAGHEAFKNAWLYLYKVITLCNHSLSVLDTNNSLLSSSYYEAYTAEIRALRAIYYWYLLDLFGRVPIIIGDDVSIYDVKQSERSEVFKFVFDELMSVKDHLQWVSSANSGNFYGRVTAPVVTFVLAKLMLNAEIYADDNWTDKIYTKGSDMKFNVYNSSLNAWEACIAFCNQLASSTFRLEPQYRTNFIIRNESSVENIWTIPMDKDLFGTHQENMTRSLHARHSDVYGWKSDNGTCATVHTMKVYHYGEADIDKRFNDNFWSGEVKDGGYPVYDRTMKPLVYYPMEAKLDLTQSDYLETAGARMRKYEIDRNAKEDGQLIDNDIVLFRFADVLLMRAEAKLRNGEDGQADMDMVRTRAGMPTRPLTLESILEERLLELCWEGWRRQDMIRFRCYESLFEGDKWDEKVDESSGFTTVYPIPKDITKLNHNLVQNPGY